MYGVNLHITNTSIIFIFVELDIIRNYLAKTVQEIWRDICQI